jgi:hypothetical protein
MPRLFHVSEEPDIGLFAPRPVPSLDVGVSGDAVWAVDEDHLPNYLLPRDCPRVTYAVGSKTTADDIARFFDNTQATRIIVVEQAWMDRIFAAVLHVYEMPPEPFELADASAGYYISRKAMEPLSARELRNPFDEIIDRGCEVRLVPDLWPLRDSVIKSTLDFSIIRMKNAQRRG